MDISLTFVAFGVAAAIRLSIIGIIGIAVLLWIHLQRRGPPPALSVTA